MKCNVREDIHPKLERVNFRECSFGNEGLTSYTVHDVYYETVMLTLKCVIVKQREKVRENLDVEKH